MQTLRTDKRSKNKSFHSSEAEVALIEIEVTRCEYCSQRAGKVDQGQLEIAGANKNVAPGGF